MAAGEDVVKERENGEEAREREIEEGTVKECSESVIRKSSFCLFVRGSSDLKKLTRTLKIDFFPLLGAILLCQSVPAQNSDRPYEDGNNYRRPRAERQQGERRNQRGEGKQRGERGPENNVFYNEFPAHLFDLVPGRLSSSSVDISVLSFADMDGYFSFGTKPGQILKKTARQHFVAGAPLEVQISSLSENTRYYYTFHYWDPADSKLKRSQEFSFTTARPAASTFSFVVQSDSHLDGGTDTEVYKRSLQCIKNSGADFLLDLGDTFMCDKYPDYKISEKQYLAQRYYFGECSGATPLFLVLGNHDGEQGWRRRGEGENIAIWSNLTRKKYFPNPVPNNFYSGNTNPDEKAGFLQDYYSWTWGDALFLTLDPFWYTEERRQGSDNWAWTLGEKQYRWLKQTLEKSRARFKFVFIHHLVGGGDKVCRGGVEAVPYFEWGGHDPDGKDLFREKRPGWPEPIHNLLVKNKVSAVFHGHDHLFARQDLDGIIYQELPQPGHNRGDGRRKAAEYGYKQGVILDGAGVLKVRVSPDEATVSFMRALYSEETEREKGPCVIEYEYKIPASKGKN